MNDSPGPYERMRRQVVRSVAWLLLVAAVIGGIIVLGRWSLNQLKTDDRFQVSFDAIDCAAPPGMKKADFLGEVRYLARLPNRIPVADPETHAKVRDAFERHPWVLLVDDLQSRPPDHLHVRLVFRQPALAVPWRGDIRVVDERGVLLPNGAAAKGLPIYQGKPSPPGEAGQPWPDADVVRRAMAQ